MRTSDECCGWLGWAELAGIGADGSPLHDSAADARAPLRRDPTSRRLFFITAVLRRALEGRGGVTR